VAAVVVLATSSALTPEQLRAFLAERLADYKVPRRIEFTDELPRNATGKILKEKLRQSLV
jgi:acyl-CoA synthetase (AMP-forming)/AMP-acid ligase II